MDHLKGILLFPPDYYGYNKGYWTGKLIVHLISKRFNVKYSVRRVCELMNEIGFSFKRPRMSSKLPDKEEQKRFQKIFYYITKSIKSVAIENGRELKYLCIDEASFRRDGTIHNGWYLKGLIPEIPESNGRFQSIKLFGAVDLLRRRCFS